MTDKVGGKPTNEAVVMEIQGVSLKDGIESKYDFSLIKCNKGGYVAVRGNDVAAHLNIDSALEFLNKDIKTFMGEPMAPPSSAEPPRLAPSVQQIITPRTHFDRVDTVHRVKATATAHNAGLSKSELMGLSVVAILTAILAVLYWPAFL